MFVSLNVLGSLVLDFTANRLDVQFLDSTGVLRDTCAIVKDSSARPFAPTGLAAASGDNRVDLNWNNTATATSYNVSRSTTSGGPYAPLATGVGSSSYLDNTAAGGTTYYYVVSAVNGNGEGSYSAQVGATPTTPGPPAPPTSLSARATGKKKINLSWNQSSSPGIASNKVYRATVSGGPYNLIATIAAATSYNNAGLNSGTTYFYVVTAVNTSGSESTVSNQASATAR
jgi:fibronectin type 3 domain-containing protein